MRVVIAGGGATGRHLAADLAERSHEVTLIEQDPATLDKARDWASGVELLLGDACEPWVLEKASLSTADVMAAVTGDDEDNLVISLLSKQEFGVPRVLARVNHPANEWMFTDQWGVDTPVSPPHIITSMVEEAVTEDDLVRILPLVGGRLSVVELKLSADSDGVGSPLSEIQLPADCAILALVREGHVVIPQPEVVLAAGDEMIALSSADAEPALSSAVLGDD